MMLATLSLHPAVKFIFCTGLAMLLGLFIGIERQWRKCAAGLRTNVLVSVGAAVFMAMAGEIGGTAAERIASYIVSGIGFLGAGVILKDGASVRGLNTAATLWCTAAIGAFCGLGYVIQPVIGSIFIVCVHILLRPLSDKIRLLSPINSGEHEEFRYHFTALCREPEENHIRTVFLQFIANDPGLMLRSITSIDSPDPSLVTVEVEVITQARKDRSMEKMASYLTMEKAVVSVKWELLGTLQF